MQKQLETVVMLVAAFVLLVGVVILTIPDPEMPGTPVKVEESGPTWPFVVRPIMPEDLDRVDGN